MKKKRERARVECRYGLQDKVSALLRFKYTIAGNEKRGKGIYLGSRALERCTAF